MIAGGKPVVVLATELFGKLTKVTLAARNLPEAVAVVLKGNPEFLDEPALNALADRALGEVLHRLRSGTGSVDRLVG